MRLFGARRKRLSAPDFSRILISSRNHCKSSKKFARPGTDDARRKLKPLMNTDEHGAAQPQPKNERLRTHWWQVWSSAFRLHWTEQAKARTPNLTAETQVVRKNVAPASRRHLSLDNSFWVNTTFAGWKPAIHFFSRPQRSPLGARDRQSPGHRAREMGPACQV